MQRKALESVRHLVIRAKTPSPADRQKEWGELNVEEAEAAQIERKNGWYPKGEATSIYAL